MSSSERAVRKLNARITNQRGESMAGTKYQVITNEIVQGRIFRRRADAEKIKAEAERIRRE